VARESGDLSSYRTLREGAECIVGLWAVKAERGATSACRGGVVVFLLRAARDRAPGKSGVGGAARWKQACRLWSCAVVQAEGRGVCVWAWRRWDVWSGTSTQPPNFIEAHVPSEIAQSAEGSISPPRNNIADPCHRYVKVEVSAKFLLLYSLQTQDIRPRVDSALFAFNLASSFRRES